MNIKSSQKLVEEANKLIKTLKAEEVKTQNDNGEITLIDIRDIRELWKDGTIENSQHIPRGMLEFWLDPESSYFNSNKFKDTKKNGFILCRWFKVSTCNKIFTRNGF